MHRLSSLQEAYNTRVAKLSHLINSKLIDKRDRLLQGTEAIDSRIEKLKKHQDEIDSEIRRECGRILERLKTAEGNKLARLNHEMLVCQEDLENIKEIKKRFMSLIENAAEENFPKFLTESSTLNNNIEFLLNKPVKEKIEIEPWDLPNELKDIRESLDQTGVLEKALQFKKELIWRFWKKKVAAEAAAMQE